MRSRKAGYGAYDHASLNFEIEGMKLVLEQMVEESGVEILYHTFLMDSTT